MMRKHLLHLAIVALMWPGAAPRATGAAAEKTAPASDLIVRCHFAGLNQLLSDTNAAKLKQVWSLPATAQFRNQVFDRFAHVPFLAVSNQLAPGTPDQAASFRPLFDDLPLHELWLAWRGPVGQPTEFVLAIQLPADRAALWNKNLQQALGAWKFGTVQATTTDAGEGWTFQHRNGTRAAALTRAGQWTVLTWGPKELRLSTQVLQRIKTTGRPAPRLADSWLEAEADLARLKPWFPLLAPYDNLPLARLTLSNRADFVRSALRLEFPRPHQWKSEPWQIPASIIRDPVISFTAAQGLAPLLKPWKAIQRLGLTRDPNQVIIWSLGGVPFHTQVAVPTADAGRALERMAPVLPSLVLSNDPQPLVGSIGYDTNAHGVVWRGLPMVIPQLTAIKDRKGEYLLGTLLPRLGTTNRPPPELFKQVEGRTDLVAYDWEFTGERLKQWRPLYQLVDIATRHAFISNEAPSQKWLQALIPILGNTVTEVTVASPTEFRVVRRSDLGLTGFEILTLTRWLDSPGFPRFTVEGQRPHPHPRQSQAPGRPAAPKR